MTGHTRIINKVIGLSYDDGGRPPTLHKLGHRERLVEPTLAVGEGGPARPDVILVSNRARHILVVECKGSGSVSRDQDAKYGKLEARSIARDIGAKSIIGEHTLACAINEASRSRIEKQTGRPLITFFPSRIMGFRKSGAAELDAEICAGIPIAGMTAPTNYPFGPDEENYEVAVRIVQCMLGLPMRGGRAGRPRDGDGDGIVDIVFEQTHIYKKIISAPHAGLIKKKIKKVIETNPDLKGGLIEHVGAIQKGEDPGAQRKFVRFYRRYLKRTAAQKTLEEAVSAGR